MSKLLKVISWTIIAIALLSAIGTHQIATQALIGLVAPKAAGWWAVLYALVAFVATAVIGAIGLNIAEINEHSRNTNELANKQLQIIERSTKEKHSNASVINKRIGLSLVSELTGLMVTALTRESPAEGSGITKGDFITHINGATLAYLPDNEARAHALLKSTYLDLTIRRGQETLELSLR